MANFDTRVLLLEIYHTHTHTHNYTCTHTQLLQYFTSFFVVWKFKFVKPNSWPEQEELCNFETIDTQLKAHIV